MMTHCTTSTDFPQFRSERKIIVSAPAQQAHSAAGPDWKHRGTATDASNPSRRLQIDVSPHVRQLRRLLALGRPQARRDLPCHLCPLVPKPCSRTRRLLPPCSGERGRRDLIRGPRERARGFQGEAHQGCGRTAAHSGPERPSHGLRQRHPQRISRPQTCEKVRPTREGCARRALALPVPTRQLLLRRQGVYDGGSHARLRTPGLRGAHRAPRRRRPAEVFRPHADPRGGLRHRQRAGRVQVNRGAWHRIPRHHLRRGARVQAIRADLGRRSQMDRIGAVAVHRGSDSRGESPRIPRFNHGV